MATATTERPVSRIPDSQPDLPPKSAPDANAVTMTVVLLAGSLMMFGWLGYIIYLAVTNGPVTIVGLLGIGAYLSLLLYLVWKTGDDDGPDAGH